LWSLILFIFGDDKINLEAQIELASLLAKNGLECPQLICQKNGTKHSLAQLEGKGQIYSKLQINK
jgi:hypothetical protein